MADSGGLADNDWADVFGASTAAPALRSCHSTEWPDDFRMAMGVKKNPDYLTAALDSKLESRGSYFSTDGEEGQKRRTVTRNSKTRVLNRAPTTQTNESRALRPMVSDKLEEIYRLLDRSPPECFPAQNGKTGQDTQLCWYSPLSSALQALDLVNGENSWMLVSGIAATNRGCGAAIASMLGLAIGDSAGHPLEFLPVNLEPAPPGIANNGGKRRPRLIMEVGADTPFHKHELNKFHLKPGQWTDDTSMALCLADSLLMNKFYHGGDARVRWHMWWVHGYCNAFRYDEERTTGTSVGLGGNICKSLLDVEEAADDHGSPAEAVPWIYGSDTNDSGNGSAMRVAPAPIAYHLSTHAALDVAALQSFATHPGAEAAACSCFMSLFIVKALTAHREKSNISSSPQVFLSLVVQDFVTKYSQKDRSSTMMAYWGAAGDQGEAAMNKLVALLNCDPRTAKEANWRWKIPRLEIPEALAARSIGEDGLPMENPNYNGHPVSRVYFGAYCLDGLAMALWGLWNTTTFKDCIGRVVNLCGDADTTGAIAGQLAGALYGWQGLVEDEWNRIWIQNLQRWDPHCEIGLRAAMLYKCFPRPRFDVMQAEGYHTVRVFKKPHGGSEQVGVLANGTEVTVNDRMKSFVHVTCDEATGWVGVKNVKYRTLARSAASPGVSTHMPSFLSGGISTAHPPPCPPPTEPPNCTDESGMSAGGSYRQFVQYEDDPPLPPPPEGL